MKKAMNSAMTTAGPIGKNIQVLLLMLAFVWALELIDILLFKQGLNRYGIYPRSIEGLRGIVFAPLLHGGISHIAANSLPFLILGFFVMLRGLSSFVGVTAIIWIVGGLGTWLTGGIGTVHIGASIIIFGYLGYLLARAYFERSMSALLIAIFVGVLYGGMILSVLPIQEGISWQGHLFGFIGGIMAAKLGSKPD